jgi:hypothetical protein
MAQLAEWRAFLKQYKEEHPELSLKQAMKDASPLYKQRKDEPKAVAPKAEAPKGKPTKGKK